MKPSTFKLVSFFISLAAAFSIIFFGLPLWLFLVMIPALFYFQLLASNAYSFRDSITLDPIPVRGYENRYASLEKERASFESCGFQKLDEFYMRTSNDVVAFVYKHSKFPVLCCHYNIGPVEIIDLCTRFRSGFRMTTSNAETAYMIDLPDNKVIQAFPKDNLEHLLHKHTHAIRFLQHQGLTPLPADDVMFREDFLKEFLSQGQQFKGLLGPIVSVARLAFGNKNRYSRTVQEQFFAQPLSRS